MNDFWDREILNNSVKDWIVALSIMMVAFVLLRLFQFVVVRKLRKFAATTSTSIDDFAIAVLQNSVMPLLYILAINFGLGYIVISAKAANIIHVALLLVVTFFVLRIITSTIGYLFKQALTRKEKTPLREKQAKGILLIIQIVVWAIGILFLIDNLGFDITTLVAGLGIGGIAIALAAQTVLGDLFSYLVIFFDKPFEIGDFIIVEDKMGTVEYIGIKTTRLRTLGGEQLICSNTDLTNSRVHNYKRMEERRAVFSFGVVYNTAAAKLKIIPPLVKKVVEELEATRFDRAHFKSFGDFSLDFEVVYYILSADYNTYMDKQQSINLRIFELFEKEHIEFAFPTQTVFVNKVNHDEMYRA